NPDARRVLLIDSLTLDLAHALSDARSVLDSEAKLDEMLAEFREIDPARADQFEEHRATIAPSELGAYLSEVGAALGERREQNAAFARREAVLKGLAELGYELGETMDAAWVRDGRLVLRKANRPDYGVELLGGVNAAKLQMRVVGFGET